MIWICDCCCCTNSVQAFEPDHKSDRTGPNNSKKIPQSTMSAALQTFAQCVALRVQKERCKEARRERNHSLNRLTWIMSQEDSQPSVQAPQEPPSYRTEDSDEEEDEEVVSFSHQLTKLISSWTLDELKILLQENACHADFVLFLKSVFESSKPKTNAGLERLLVAFEYAVQALADRPVIRRSDIASELLQQTKLVPARRLAYITEKTLDIALAEQHEDLQEVLEILCKLVNALASFPLGLLDPDQLCSANFSQLQSMDGKQFKLFVVRQLCDSKTITERTLVPLMSALKDLCYNVERDESKTSRLVFDRMERRACDWLQRLRQSDKLGKICLHFFALSRFFASKDRASGFVLDKFFDNNQEEPVALQVFGQVLTNFTLVCSQDAELGRAFLKELDSSSLSAPFTKTGLAFLLSLSRIKRFEEPSFDLFLRKTKHQDSTILVDLCNDIAICKHGSWDLLLPSLVKASTKLADSETVVLPQPHFDLTSDNSMGVRVLAHCFTTHPLCRIDLLNELFKRSLCGPLQQVLPFSRMFYLLMQNEDMNKSILADYTQVIKDLISLLPNCHPRIAHGLLKAIFAPTSARREMQEIRDHAMVVFRKTLFLREARPRFVALFGILALFKQEEDEDALNCLKRCLSQQSEVRAALYAGLLALPPVCSELVVLPSHFKQLLDESNDADIPPLHFHSCVDASSGRMVEPIAGLLQSAIHAGFDCNILIHRIANASIGLFSLDKTCSFDSAVTGGAANRSTAIMVIETCEVLINYLMERNLGAQSDIAKLWRLQRAIRRLVDMNTVTEQQPKVKRVKKSAAEEEDEEYGAPESKTPAKKRGRPSAMSTTSSSSTVNVNADAPLPEEGAWLSERTLLVLFSKAQTVTVENMVEVAVEKPNELQMLLTRTGFHSYLLQCIKLRLKQVSKLCQTAPNPFAKQQHDDVLQYSKDMAKSCAGAKDMDYVLFCNRLGPLLLKAASRYEKLQALSQSDGGGVEEAVVEEPATKKKKRKNTGGGATSASSANAMTSPQHEAAKLREHSVDCLRDLITCLSKTATTNTGGSNAVESFEQVVANTFSLQPALATKANVFHLAAEQMFGFVKKNFTQARLSSAFASFDMYCLIVNQAIVRAAADGPSDEESVVAHHVNLCRQLLSNYELKSGVHVKQVVKFYLELNTKHCKGDLSLICSELASHVMKKTDEEELKMVWHSPHATLQVLIAHVMHTMEDMESKLVAAVQSEDSQGSNNEKMKPLVHQLEQVSQLVAVFLQRSEEEDSSAFNLDSELLLKAVIKFYRVMAKLFKLLASRKEAVECAGDVVRLVQQVAKHLSPLVDERLKDMQSQEQESSVPTAGGGGGGMGKKPTKKAATTTVKKKTTSPSSKLVPEVVFCLEQYEVTLLKASKACGGSLEALIKYVRRTTARDFRVDLDKLKTALEEEEDEENTPQIVAVVSDAEEEEGSDIETED